VRKVQENRVVAVMTNSEKIFLKHEKKKEKQIVKTVAVAVVRGVLTSRGKIMRYRAAQRSKN